MKLPVKYAAARAALAAASSIDEVKDIRDKARAVEVYAYQATGPELVGYCTEIKREATRRLGEVMAENKAAGKMDKGGRPPKNRVSQKPGNETLADQGVDKNLADSARKLAAMPAEKFEADTIRAKKIAVAAVLGNKEVITAARAERHKTKRAKRESREKELAVKITALPDQKYGVILADPPWRFEVYSEKGLASSSADNHYPTSALDEIKALDVPSISADDCVPTH